MPPIIAAVAAFAATSALNAIIVNLAIGLIVSAGLSAVSTLFGPKPEMPNLSGFTAETTGRTQQIRQPVSDWEYVLGELRKSGPLTFIESTNNNKHLHMVITLACHVCDSFLVYYLNDIPIYPSQLDSDGLVTTGRYANKVRIQGNLGTTDQPFPDLVNESDGLWTEDHKQAGRTKIYVRLESDREIFAGGLPKISVKFRGILAFDDRTSTTAWTQNVPLCAQKYMLLAESVGGMGATSSDIDSTELIASANISDEIVDTLSAAHVVTAVDTTNEVLSFGEDTLEFQSGDRVEASTTGTLPAGLAASPTVYYVIVVREKENSVLGIGISLAANLADAYAGTAVNITDAGSGTHTITRTGEPRYTCNGVVKTNRRPHQILANFRSAMAGKIFPVGGVWLITAGAYVAPTITFDESDVIGAITVNTKHPRKDRFNAVKGVYVSPLNNDQPTEYPSITSDALENADGRRLFKTLDGPMTSRAPTMQRLAWIALQQHSRETTIETTFNLRGLLVRAGNNITFDNTRFGFSSQAFEVVEWSLTLSDDEVPALLVRMVLRQTDSNVWAWTTELETISPPTPLTNLPDAFTILPPTNVVPTSGTADLFTKQDGTVVSRIRVSYTASTDSYVSFHRVEYKKTADSDWLALQPVPTPQAEVFIWEVDDGIDYDVRVIAINHFGGESIAVTITDHTVVGKSEVPLDVRSFSASQNGENTVLFLWQSNNEADIAGYDIRRNLRDVVYNHDEATPVTTTTRGSTITTVRVPPGDHSFGIKALDTSGNESTNATVTRLDVLTDFDTIFIEAEGNIHGSDFTPGDVDGFLIHPFYNILIPDSTVLASTDTAQDVFDEFVWMPVTLPTYVGPIFDNGIAATEMRLWGEVLSLPNPIDGPPVADTLLGVRYGDDGNILMWANLTASPQNLSTTAPDQITRADAGSFITDGFTAGQFIILANSATQDGTYEIEVVAALAITTVETSLASEAGSGDETLEPNMWTADANQFWGGFSDWENIDVAVVVAQFIQHRVQMDTSVTTSMITAFKGVADIGPIEEGARNVTIAASGGTTINFTKVFFQTPRLSVTPLTSALTPVVTSVTSTGFTLQLFDSSGVDVGGTADWIAQTD